MVARHTDQARRGAGNSAVLLGLGSLALIVGLALLLLWKPEGKPADGGGGAASGVESAAGNASSGEAGLVLYCAAGMRAPVAEAAEAFGDEFGIPVELQYGGSGTLLSNLELSGVGDLYLAADQSYTDIAHDKGLVKERLPVALLRPVIAVAKGNPKGIEKVADLLREDVSFALANPDAASVGKQTKKVLEKTGQWSAIEKAAEVFKPTVNEVANDVKLGIVDAGIVWDATVGLYPELESVHTAEFDADVKQVTIAVLTSSEQPTAALRFARYLTAPQKGLQAFEDHGFEVVRGDPWAVNPEVVLFSGTVNRPAIEDSITEFEQREGCVVQRVYNGCGILVGQMKAGESPDAYFACDRCFVGQVSDIFPVSQDISSMPMVLVVPAGNPKGLKTLEDLTEPGLKIGLCRPDQSALGFLTKQMLENAGLYEKVRPNVVNEQATGDALIPHLTTEALDAAILYAVNASVPANKGLVEVIPIEVSDALAVQPFAIHRETKYPRLLGRLIEKLTSDASRDRFTGSGFEWLATEPVAAGESP